MLGIKSKIQQYFHERGDFLSLERLEINPIGYTCNHNCPMCWRQSLSNDEKLNLSKNHKTDLNLGDYINLINNLPKTVKYIDIVGGGEPLLYPKLKDLFEIIRLKHLRGMLMTNGSLLSPGIIHALISTNFESIRISLHAASRRTYNKIHGVDHFNQVISNIKRLILLRKLSPLISLYFVIQNNNISEIESFVNLAYQLQVDKIEFGSLILYENNNAHLSVDYNRAIESLEQIRNTIHIDNNCDVILNQLKSRKASVSGDSIRDKNQYDCPLIYNHLEILSNGNTYPCCISLGHIPGISIKEHSISEVWNMYHNFRRNIIQGKFYPFCESECTIRLLK